MLVGQLWTAVLLLGAMVGAGAGITAAISRRLELPTGTRIALIGSTGFAFVGVATLVVGHLHLLGPWLPYGLAAGGGVLGVIGRRELVETSTRAWRGIARQFKVYPIPLTAVSLALMLAAAASLTRPWRRDEVEYHWPAPLAWAENGGWNDSPFRHVDGFPFMEVVYTSAATQQSYVAAHLLHFAMFLTLGFAAAGVAASMGVRGTGVTAATVLAMPVVWDSAYAAYNDTPVATLTVTAVGLVLAAPRDRLAATAIAGALLAVATSIKPIAVAGVGLIGLMVLIQFLTDRRPAADASAAGSSAGHQALRTAPRLRTVLLQWVLLAAPVLVTLAFWSLRQYLLTGHLIDPAAGGERSADAQSRMPESIDRIIAPVLPFVSGLIGSTEPWGGRTAVAMQLFLIPALVYVIWRRGTVLRRFALMVVPAWASWIVLGFATVRTRFHVASWALIIIGIRVAFEDFCDRRPRARFWLELAWTVCVLLGLADSSFETIRALRSLVGG